MMEKINLFLIFAVCDFYLPHRGLKYFLWDKIIYNLPVIEAGITLHLYKMGKLMGYPLYWYITEKIEIKK